MFDAWTQSHFFRKSRGTIEQLQPMTFLGSARARCVNTEADRLIRWTLLLSNDLFERLSMCVAWNGRATVEREFNLIYSTLNYSY